MMMLIQHGHRVVPVQPILKTIDKIPVYESMGSVKELIHTLTVYVSLAICDQLEAEILKLML